MAPSKKSAGKGVGKKSVPAIRKAPARPRNSKKMINNTPAATISPNSTPQSGLIEAAANTQSQPAASPAATPPHPDPVPMDSQPQPAVPSAPSANLPPQPVASSANATSTNTNSQRQNWNDEFRISLLVSLVLKLGESVPEQAWRDVAQELKTTIRPRTTWNGVRFEFSRMKRDYFLRTGIQAPSDQQEHEQ